MTGLSRRDSSGDGPPRAAVIGSLSIHGGLLVLWVLAGMAMPHPPELQSIRVRLVAVAPEDAPIRADPAPPEVAEEEFRPPPPDPTPDPLPEVETPKVEDEPPPVEREPEPEPARTEDVGEEAINVQTDGATFADPSYMNNIIRQVNRYWRPPTGGRAYRAEISFVIHRDGSVSNIEWVRRSGSPQFDLLCMSAVESAGRAQAFGPLPASYPRDQLFVSFYFDPTVR
ncbi:MAG: TonB C-terminal domain-containing protein [Gemmatimonadota bacterium]|nr:TonB C-terminal domain-containing protein [Gemmatimonadota bacterium]